MHKQDCGKTANPLARIRFSFVGLLAICAFGLLAAGCLSKYYFRPNYNSVLHEQIQGKRVVLHPLVIAGGAPPIPEEDYAQANKLISEYLLANGYRVELKKIEKEVSRSLLLKVIKRTNTPEFYEYFQTYREDDQCDFVVLPFVILRQAELRGHKGRWDGVIRPIPFDGSGHGMEWRGYQKAASLSVTVFSCKGERVHTSLGGLEIAFSTNYDAGVASPVSGAPVRTQYMANPAVVKEAISLSLHPMIPMAGYPKSPKYYKQHSHEVTIVH